MNENEIKKENENKTTITISAISNFKEDFVKEKFKDVQCYKTGFATLDKALQGGFYEGNMNLLTAESSYGKTTLAIQIAENIAREYDADVFIFSLETPKKYIFAKSINRLTYYAGDNTRNPEISAMTSINRKMYEALDDENREMLDSCTEDYFKTYGNNIYIHDVVGADFSAKNVLAILSAYRQAKPDRKLFVLVDYLQILAPCNPKTQSDTERIKENVLELKKTCSACKCTMLVLSSKSRDKYEREASMANFFGSSCIEYTADVAFDMTVYTGEMKGDEKSQEIKRQLQSNDRDMLLTMLKQRYGKRMNDTHLRYRADKDVFVEDVFCNIDDEE